MKKNTTILLFCSNLQRKWGNKCILLLWKKEIGSNRFVEKKKKKIIHKRRNNQLSMSISVKIIYMGEKEKRKTFLRKQLAH